MNSQYQVRPLVPVDRISLEDLYRAVYENAYREKTNFGWTLDLPLTEGGAAVALAGDVVVAAQPYCDIPLHTPWGRRRSTLFLDVATHPAHRRRGLFRRVVDAASKAAFERGSSIIMTTPNRAAARGFQTVPGWVRLCSLDCLFLPLGVGDRVMGAGLLSLGARLTLATASLCWRLTTPPGLSTQSKGYITAPWSPNSDADRLWTCLGAGQHIMVVRDRAFLRWRFGPDYQLFLAHGSETPTAYAAGRVVRRAGVKIGLLLDCIAADGGTSAVRLLTSMIAWLRDQGASAALGYFLRRSVPWQRAREAGFLPLPRFCSPRNYPVYAYVRPGDLHTADLLNPSGWHMSLADSDLG